MNKTLLLIQPGAFGDIFTCAPIAKHYSDLGYTVYWPTTNKFKPTVNYFDYVEHIMLDDAVLHPDWLRSDVIKCLKLIPKLNPTKILNLADRGPHPTAQMGYEKAEEAKYRLSELDFDVKNTLVWSRNLDKENELYDRVVGDCGEYIVGHLVSSRNDRTSIPTNEKRKLIEIQEIVGFGIPDWYKIIKNAKAVYCVESSVQCFIDGFSKDLKSPKYLLSRSTLKPGTRYTISKNWSLDYMK